MAGEIADSDPQIQMLAHRCDVWMNGICWDNDEVEVIVEVTEHYRCVTVVTSVNDIEKSREVFNDVIKTILTLKSQMHSFECEVYFIAHSDVAKAHNLPVSKRILYNIKDIARSVLTKYNVTDDTYIKKVAIEQIVGVHDPFYCIAPSVTKALFNTNLSLQEHNLQHVVARCPSFSFSLSHMSVKERCSQLSVFAGCNPLVSIS